MSHSVILVFRECRGGQFPSAPPIFSDGTIQDLRTKPGGTVVPGLFLFVISQSYQRVNLVIRLFLTPVLRILYLGCVLIRHRDGPFLKGSGPDVVNKIGTPVFG